MNKQELAKFIEHVWDCRKHGMSAEQIAKVLSVRASIVHDVLQFRLTTDEV